MEAADIIARHKEIAQGVGGDVRLSSATATLIERLLEATSRVLSTFEKDEAQGFHSRDRQFAIAILRKAIEPAHSEKK